MNKRTGLIVASLSAIGLLAAIGAAVFVLRPTAAPSGEFTPIPIEPSQPASTVQASSEDAGQVTAQSSEPLAFHIDTNQSQARFEIGEILNGSFNLVIGISDQVAGEILIDVAEPANTQIGVIQVNARAFATDSSLRNRAINNSILETNAFEFITFTPSSIDGLPENAAVGDTLEFQVTGDLAIRDFTAEITFDVVVDVVAADRLEGEATASILRGDYGLTIPQVPSVASVDEEVVLALEFVAVP